MLSRLCAIAEMIIKCKNCHKIHKQVDLCICEEADIEKNTPIDSAEIE